MTPRYTIFGCQNDALVEKTAVTLAVARMLASTMADCGFKPRVWDRVYNKFISN